jgi:TRAP-type mannitol/chloroaromatic compound transport system permease large subunit
MFILIGATVFSLVFQAADGPVWVEHLLASCRAASWAS